MAETKGAWAKVKSISEEDWAASFSVPTIATNHFLAQGNPNAFRIAFGDNPGAGYPIEYRVAVIMSPFEAFELRNVLTALLEPKEAEFQAQLDALVAAQEQPQED